MSVTYALGWSKPNSTSIHQPQKKLLEFQDSQKFSNTSFNTGRVTFYFSTESQVDLKYSILFCKFCYLLAIHESSLHPEVIRKKLMPHELLYENRVFNPAPNRWMNSKTMIFRYNFLVLFLSFCKPSIISSIIDGQIFFHRLFQ